MDFKDKKVLVFGSGISGIGACELLEKSGATVILFDGNEKLHEEAIRMKLPSASKAQILIGQISDEQLKELDLVVLSPGVPTDLPVVEKMKAAGIRIWGEVELAYENAKGDVLAITGTNGKTTTTSLLGEIMKCWKESVYVVGNIGNPYTQAAPKMTEESVTVAEISSFQLEMIDQFHPKDLKYHTGSSEPPSYHGGVHKSQRAHHQKSDIRRYLCPQLRRSDPACIWRKSSDQGIIFQQ